MTVPASYLQPKHPHAFGAVPGINGQNMAATWQGPGGAHYPTHRVAVTGGAVEGASPDASYGTSRRERRRIAKQNRR